VLDVQKPSKGAAVSGSSSGSGYELENQNTVHSDAADIAAAPAV
jgi:hypothetical protein